MNQMGQQLIKDLHLEALSAEEQAQVVEKFADVLFNAILARGIGSLTEQQKDALNAELKTKGEGSQDAVMDFLMTNVPGFSSIVEEETNRLHERIAAIKQ